MSDPETFPAEVHPEVALLPWYANNTLADQERNELSRHLEHCVDCRTELEELRKMKRLLDDAYSTAPLPSASLEQSVLQRLAADSPPGIVKGTRRSSLEILDAWIRSMLNVRWMPTVSAAVILVQAGILAWVMSVPTVQDRVLPRSVGSPTVSVAVSFHPHATDEQIRSVLDGVRGRIVGGPSAEGIYTIEMPATDQSASRQKLEVLRRKQEVVRSADLLIR
ncbi:hypothetical protein W02_04600 [Nitrospira sp. KM1]|uniref:anti-sigma factor n=1 Tax=Nitrospira sp. KM1 TaxID=1936990 RepID=UPI0013A73EC0|nr:zf-HC2 domain-containing protein [Nitrospira sp. KM1]BCA53320.1 hypothetical protein W02_04600 [Nitrospira sp. KM1]